MEQMKSKKFPKGIIVWYEQYLRNRVAHSTLKGHTCSIKVTNGTPQGGFPADAVLRKGAPVSEGLPEDAVFRKWVSEGVLRVR